MGTGSSDAWMIQVVFLIGFFASILAQRPPPAEQLPFPPENSPILNPPSTDGEDLKFTPDIVVAQDGTGDFLTVQEAVEYAPENDRVEQTTIILIKPGIYNEQVFIDKPKKYITMVGYPGRTIITNDYHALTPNPKYNPNLPTLGFQRPNGNPFLNSLINDTTNRPFIGTSLAGTFIVRANGFTGVGITFRNTYGPTSSIRKFAMAPAFRAMADKVLLQYCSFEGWQDTLYAHRGVQLYRNCYISGSVDFIFGYARAWFQNCVIEVKGPPGYPGTICAQARTSLMNFDGFVILDSYIRGYGVANLGRAWRNFSTVLYARNYMEDVINGPGWNDFGFPDRQETVKFMEFQNRGPGSNRSLRVGYSEELTEDEAAKYLNETFLKLDLWYREPPAPPTPFSYPQSAIPLSPPPFSPPFTGFFTPPLSPPPPVDFQGFPPPGGGSLIGINNEAPVPAPSPDAALLDPNISASNSGPSPAPNGAAEPPSIISPTPPPTLAPADEPAPAPAPPPLIPSANTTRTAIGQGWQSGNGTLTRAAAPPTPASAVQVGDNPLILGSKSPPLPPSSPSPSATGGAAATRPSSSAPQDTTTTTPLLAPATGKPPALVNATAAAFPSMQLGSMNLSTTASSSSSYSSSPPSTGSRSGATTVVHRPAAAIVTLCVLITVGLLS